jgi:O-antigen ligase
VAQVGIGAERERDSVLQSANRATASGPALLLHAATLLITLGVLSLPFQRLLQLPLGGSFVELCDVLFALGACAALLAVLRGSEPFVWRPAYVALGGYVLWCAGSYWTAANHKAWLVHCAAAVYQAGLCVALATLLAHPERRRLVLGAWLTGAALTVALGLVCVALFYLGVRDRVHNPLLWNYGSVPVGDYPRVRVLFRNGNALCNYLLVSVGVALALCSEWRRVSGGPLWTAIALTLVVAVFTLSPSFGGILLLLGLWLRHAPGELVALGRGLRRAALAAGVAAALAFVALGLVSLVSPGQGSINVGSFDLAFSHSPRMAAWSSAAGLFAERPLLGQGLGAPSAWISDPRLFVPRDRWTDALLTQHFAPRPSDAHNTALSLLSQLGLPGLALFATFIALTFRALAGARPALRLALGAALASGLLYHGLFASLEETRHVWLLIGLCLAVAPGRARGAGTMNDAQPRAPSAGFGSTGLPASS